MNSCSHVVFPSAGICYYMLQNDMCQSSWFIESSFVNIQVSLFFRKLCQRKYIHVIVAQCYVLRCEILCAILVIECECVLRCGF